MRAPAWYVVQAKRHHEERVRAHLARRALLVFLPLLEVVHRYRARRVRRLEPLFPGYLFVRVDGEAAAWEAVRWTPGVHRILTVADEPVAVPDGTIEAIQARIGTLGFVRPGTTYRMGSQVRILRGPLAGLDAVFARPMSRTGRVRVLVQWLGGRRRVELDELDLEPV